MRKTSMQTAIRRMTLAVVVAGTLSASAALAQYVQVAPPPPVIERPYAPPGHGYIWVPGYHRWDGARYVWVGGRWALPPRPAAVWISGHWAATPHGWHWIPGHWRG